MVAGVHYTSLFFFYKKETAGSKDSRDDGCSQTRIKKIIVHKIVLHSYQKKN